MASRPRLYRGAKLPGLAALALFVLLAAVFLSATFEAGAGFPADVSITEQIGLAMFDLDQTGVPSEGFLAAFEIVDVVLVAALVGAVMLARRDSEGGSDSSMPEFGDERQDESTNRGSPENPFNTGGQD